MPFHDNNVVYPDPLQDFCPTGGRIAERNASRLELIIGSDKTIPSPAEVDTTVLVGTATASRVLRMRANPVNPMATGISTGSMAI